MFYFRFIIPINLRVMAGISELRFSLQTEQRQAAIICALPLIGDLPRLVGCLQRMADNNESPPLDYFKLWQRQMIANARLKISNDELKQELEAYPVGWLDKPELHAVNGLLEVENVPGGFCCLTRDVFAKLKEALPRPYGHYEFEGQAYWHSPYMNGRLYGEDAAFCHDWRSIGGEVWLDPELNLTHHAGATAYKGHIGQWLKTRN